MWKLRERLQNEKKWFIRGFKGRMAPIKPALVSCFIVSFISGFHEYGLVAFFRSYALSTLDMQLNRAVPFVLAIIGLPYTLMNVPVGYTLSERFGSRRIMIAGQVMMFLYSAFGVLTCAFSFCLYSWTTGGVSVLLFTLVFFAFGLVFVNVNFIPIVLEQIPNQGSDERSSCVHWTWLFFYFGRLTGTLISSAVVLKVNPVYMFAINLLMAVVALMILTWTPMERFIRNTKSPLNQIWTVTRAVLKQVKCKKGKVEEEQYHTPARFQHYPPDHKPSVFEKVSKDFGGELPIDDVRDVQKFFLITLMLCSCIGIYIIYSLLSTAYVPEVSKMKIPPFLVDECDVVRTEGGNKTFIIQSSHLPVAWLSSISDITTVVMLAVLDLLIYPRFIHKLNTRRRILIGTVFGFLASVASVVTESFRHFGSPDSDNYLNRFAAFYSAPSTLYTVKNLSSLASLPQYICYGFMVAFVQPGATELALVSAPIRMRKLLFAVLLSILGAAQVLGAIMILSQSAVGSIWCFFCNHDQSTGFFVFIITAAVTLSLLVVYWMLSKLYHKFELTILVPYNPDVPKQFSRTPLHHLDT